MRPQGAKAVTEEALALPLGELSPQVTERANDSGKNYLFSIATATSKATFIMVVKEFWRCSAVVSSPVRM